MEAAEFLGMEPTADPLRWQLPVVPAISTPGRFLFGGCALAAAVLALERVADRPLIWATAQYLSYASTGSELEVEVRPAVTGRSVTQARATGWSNGTEVFTVNAALGRRPFEASGSWAERPEVPGPELCGRRTLMERHDDTIMSVVEIRLADARDLEELDGVPGSGRSAVWARVPGLTMSAATLAVFGDWVPYGISQALGIRGGGNSLDNTLRVVQVVPTEWVLLDIRVQAVAGGFGHGLVHLWAEDGTLLATASQSTIVRFWKDGLPPGG